MTKEMPNSVAWKIAPGNGAVNWDVFHSSKCIGIGWLSDYDFNDFEDVDHVLATLVENYGERIPGCGSGAARIIWAFTNQIKRGHVVVANSGYNSVVGIGLIDGEYIPPHSKSNPLFNDESTHRHHVRPMKWLISKPVTIKGSRFFIQGTVGPLTYDHMKTIRNAYMKSYPNDSNIQKQFKTLFAKLTIQSST